MNIQKGLGGRTKNNFHITIYKRSLKINIIQDIPNFFPLYPIKKLRSTNFNAYT